MASSLENITELLRVQKLREFLGSLKNASFHRNVHHGVSNFPASESKTTTTTITTIESLRISKRRKQVKFEVLTVVSLNITNV